MKTPLINRSLAEFLSTYCLVLIGCGAMVVNGETQALTHVGVATVWGLIVMVMIYAVGPVSGAHMNPAVTIAFTVARRLPLKDAIAYVPSQCAGAIAGAASLAIVFGSQASFLGATLVQLELTPQAGFAIEAMMTAILMFVVMGVSTGAKEETITAGLAVGATIAMEAFVAGPLTNASMNPARSLGPAIVSGMTTDLWLYIAAPIAGALIGCGLHRLIKPGSTDLTILEV
ncbi:aquaporin [Rubripirellula amarantea]|uniref:Aquaporin Z 2 n=1 Tax=Rubripirellula amarantea TaxID=2527999 RepID=A0A5C5WW96_9BACT|nr:aquaporin [Rubripirellula amarantea]MDA8745593.1 aquaporin [Rubripirellula amarantea]TWT54132.1 Aquaporin Z 2 [Rubripirellula amarantea]